MEYQYFDQGEDGNCVANKHDPCQLFVCWERSPRVVKVLSPHVHAGPVYELGHV